MQLEAVSWLIADPAPGSVTERKLCNTDALVITGTRLFSYSVAVVEWALNAHFIST